MLFTNNSLDERTNEELAEDLDFVKLPFSPSQRVISGLKYRKSLMLFINDKRELVATGAINFKSRGPIDETTTFYIDGNGFIGSESECKKCKIKAARKLKAKKIVVECQTNYYSHIIKIDGAEGLDENTLSSFTISDEGDDPSCLALVVKQNILN